MVGKKSLHKSYQRHKELLPIYFPFQIDKIDSVKIKM